MFEPEEVPYVFALLNKINNSENPNSLQFTKDEGKLLKKCISLELISGAHIDMYGNESYGISGDLISLTKKGILYIKPFSNTSDVRVLIKEILSLVSDNHIYMFNNQRIALDSALSAAFQSVESEHLIAGIKTQKYKPNGLLVFVPYAMITQAGAEYLNSTNKNENSNRVSINIQNNNGTVTGVNNGSITNTVENPEEQIRKELQNLVDTEGLKESFKDELLSAINSKDKTKLQKFESFLKSHKNIATLAGQIIPGIIGLFQ